MGSTNDDPDRRASIPSDVRRQSTYPEDASLSTPETEEKLLRFRLSVGSEFTHAALQQPITDIYLQFSQTSPFEHRKAMRQVTGQD